MPYGLKLVYHPSLWSDPMDDLTKTILNAALDNGIKLAVLVASAVGAYLLSELRKFVKVKTGKVISDEDASKAEEALKKGILRAEEWARKTYVIDNRNGEKVPPTGEMKMAVAVEMAKSIHPPLSLVEPARMEDEIDAMLAKMRPSLSLIPSAKPGSLRPMAHLSGLSQIPKAPGIPVEAYETDRVSSINPPRNPSNLPSK